MGTVNQAEVSPNPSVAEVQFYESRFTNEEDIRVTITSNYPATREAVNQAGDLVRTLRKAVDERGDGNIGKAITAMSDECIRIMFRGAATVGLKRFAPDFRQGPDTTYNVLLENVCAYTFRQCVNINGYRAFGVGPGSCDDDHAFSVLYRSFVFSYLKELVLTEEKHPGKVARDKARNLAGQRRIQVCFLQFRTTIWTYAKLSGCEEPHYRSRQGTTSRTSEERNPEP